MLNSGSRDSASESSNDICCNFELSGTLRDEALFEETLAIGSFEDANEACPRELRTPGEPLVTTGNSSTDSGDATLLALYDWLPV